MKMKSVLSAVVLSLAMLAATPVFAEGKVNINSATAEQLAEVKGIGPSLSDAIITYRKEHGPFKNIDALINVRGIGSKKLEKLRGQLVVGAKEK